MTPTQKKFLLETLGVKPKTKLIGKGDDRVQATTAFEDFRKREAAVIKKLDDLRKIHEAAEDVRKFEAEVEAAQARTKTAKKGDVQDVKAKCKEAEGMLAVTEKAVIVAIKAETDPKLKAVLSTRSKIDGNISKLEANPTLKSLLGAEITKVRSKIAAGLAKAHPGKDPDGGRSDLLDAQLDLDKALAPVAKEQVEAAERQVKELETHPGHAAVADPEIKNMRAKIDSAANKFTDLAKVEEAMTLLAEIPGDCQAAKVIAEEYAGRVLKLREDIDNLTDPAFADTEAVKGLQSEREAATSAFRPSFPRRSSFRRPRRRSPPLAKRWNWRKPRVADKRKKLLEDVGKLADPAFADTEAVKGLQDEREAATGALSAEFPTPQQFQAAEKAIVAFGQIVELEKTRVVEKRRALLENLGKLSDPGGADTDEKKATKAERDKAGTALSAETPIPADIKKAETAIAALDRLVKQAAKLDALAVKNPAAAGEARKAFKDFKNVIGDAEVTPEAIATATTDRGEREKELGDAIAAYEQANALPEGTEEEKRIKEEAVENATDAYWEAKGKSDEAVAREKALLGHKLLTDAISHGPLSGESGRPFKASTAETLVKAFTKDPRLADAAVKAATTAKYPDAVAGGIDMMISKVENGFESTSGTAFRNADYARRYGEKLLRMGGEVGDEFFARLPDYIDSGHQFDDKPLGDSGATTFTDLRTERALSSPPAW